MRPSRNIYLAGPGHPHASPTNGTPPPKSAARAREVSPALPAAETNGAGPGHSYHAPLHASPSLVQGDEAAFELKLCLPPELAGMVEGWARQRLAPDLHGDDGRYRTTSLYCDTSNLDVYRRTKGHRRRKYRLRRYGDMTTVFLERKNRQGDRVAKHRAGVPIDDLAYLAGVEPADGWAGAWFLDRLRVRDLRPTCRIVYARTAFMGEGSAAGLRLTIDRDLIGVPTRDWDLSPVTDGKHLLPEAAILELKFRDTLPPMFRDLLALLPPDLGRVSKYRLCVRAWGLAGEET